MTELKRLRALRLILALLLLAAFWLLQANWYQIDYQLDSTPKTLLVSGGAAFQSLQPLLWLAVAALVTSLALPKIGAALVSLVAVAASGFASVLIFTEVGRPLSENRNVQSLVAKASGIADQFSVSTLISPLFLASISLAISCVCVLCALLTLRLPQRQNKYENRKSESDTDSFSLWDSQQ